MLKICIVDTNMERKFKQVILYKRQVYNVYPYNNEMYR